MSSEVKYHINCQSKHGLWDSRVKTGKFLPGDSQEQKHVLFGSKSKKNAICDGTPHLQIKSNLYEWRKVQRFQILKQLKYLNWFKFYCISLIWVTPALGRGLVGKVDGEGIWGMGGAPTCMHTHVHTHTCTHNVKKLQMATNMFIRMWSLWSPHSLCHPHIIPIIPTKCLYCPCHLHIIFTPPFNPVPGDPQNQ